MAIHGEMNDEDSDDIDKELDRMAAQVDQRVIGHVELDIPLPQAPSRADSNTWMPELRNCKCCQGYVYGCQCISNGATSCTLCPMSNGIII
jgi:hypothetical protein